MLAKSDLGKVFLVRRDNKEYAMKTIIKDQIRDQSLLKECIDEKQLLLKSKHPFIINLEYVFNTQNRVFLVMPYERACKLSL